MAINYKYERRVPTLNHNAFVEEYFSGPDVRIYLDGVEQKEIMSLQYSVQEQLKPIYGYASRTFDDVAVGSRIVIGSFQVPLSNYASNNFVASEYDYEPSKNESRSIPRPSWVEASTFADESAASAMPASEAQVFKTVTYYYSKSTTNVLRSPKETAQIMGEIMIDEEFEIEGEIGEWLLIKTTKLKGYALRDMLL